MGIARGTNIVRDGLLFGYDTGYGVADNTIDTRFYPGEPTVNLLDNSDDWSSNWTGNLFSNWINATVTANAGVAPDGTTTASKLTGGYSRWQRINCSTSTTYTFSFWIKNIDLRIAPNIHIAFGLNGSLVNYNNKTSIALNTIDEWTRVSKTHTSPSSGINQMEVGVEWSSNHPNTDSVLVWHAMCEQNSHMTPFAYKNNDRSSTQSLIDLKKTTNIDVSNVSFDSTGQPDFDGTDDRIVSSTGINLSSYTSLTYEGVVKAVGLASHDRWFSGTAGSSSTFHNPDLAIGTDGQLLYIFANSGIGSWNVPSGLTIDTTKFNHLVYTFTNTGVVRIYINGTQQYTATHSNATFPNGSRFMTGSRFDNNGEAVDGSIPIAKVYSKALTADEVMQNYKAYKNRFNL